MNQGKPVGFVLASDDTHANDTVDSIGQNLKVAPLDRAKRRRVVLLMIGVIVTGSLFTISGNIRAKELGKYSGVITTFLNSIAYVVVYFPVLWIRYQKGIVSTEQIRWAWRWHFFNSSSGGLWRRLGNWKYMFLGGLCDCISQFLQFMSQPYVPIAAQVILHQFNLVWTTIFSVLLLHVRFTFVELCGVALAAIGGTVTLITISADDKKAETWYLFLMILSSAPPAFILKEMMFRAWNSEKTQESQQANPFDNKVVALDIWCVNTGAALWQFVWVFPVSLPIVLASKESDLPLGQYLSDAWGCFCNTPESGCEAAWQTYLVYIVLDILFNVFVYMLVREGSALLTFVSLKIMAPVSAILALIPWPFLGAQKLKGIEIAVLFIVLSGAAVFRFGNVHKEQVRSKNICCWPLCG